jgi:hypothetical protein
MRLFGAMLCCIILAACGQDPSFLEEQARFKSRTDQNNSDDAEPINVGGEGNEELSPDDQEALLPGGGVNDNMPDWIDGQVDADGDGVPDGDGDNTASGDNPTNYDIPGADVDDLDVLHRCLKKFKNAPFGSTITNFRKIYASVSVGGAGTPINDTQTTQDPELVLIYAGVNVGGAPTWNLLNGNGYYCMKVNVNVGTDFTINLHCNARLADSSVNVNVGSTQSDTSSQIGVHVGSNMTINSVAPQGDKCIR